MNDQPIATRARIHQMREMGAVEFRVTGSYKSTRLKDLALSARNCGAKILDQCENADNSESLWIIPQPKAD